MLRIGFEKVTPTVLEQYCFSPETDRSIEFASTVQAKVEGSRDQLLRLLEKSHLVYGVNTGFGDSSRRVVTAEQSEALQENLIAYLLCGSGEPLPTPAVRAMVALRLLSLSQGLSGVSWELIERLKVYLENDWLPVVPSRGSLGASGDLVPLAYLAQVIQGEGRLQTPEGKFPTIEVLQTRGIATYRLKAKEGLALVNGTSAMAGMAFYNCRQLRFCLELITQATAWSCLALLGRREAFSPLVNEVARSSPGQKAVAARVLALLEEESYLNVPLSEIGVRAGEAEHPIQDKYSLRCVPQILGPVQETLAMVEGWLACEVESVSDNPLIDPDGQLGNGGNFYGGYLTHAMDYLKICVGNMADLADRQVANLVDEKSNRGLPPNLSDWVGLPVRERFLHHGLKGVHQSVSALTSEVLALCHPNSLHSRSSESHNQDKVSLGMSGAIQCHKSLNGLFQILAQQLTCLCQALDLRGVALKGKDSQHLYALVRSHVPFVDRDRPLDTELRHLARHLREVAVERGTFALAQTP